MATRLETARGKSPEAAVAAANEMLNAERDVRITLDVVAVLFDPNAQKTNDAFVVVLRREASHKRVFMDGEDDDKGAAQ